MSRDEREFLQKLMISKVGEIEVYKKKAFNKLLDINDLSKEDGLSRSRVKKIIVFRIMYFAFCRTVLHYKFREIGGTDYAHGTIVNSLKQHSNLLSYDLTYIDKYEEVLI